MSFETFSHKIRFHVLKRTYTPKDAITPPKFTFFEISLAELTQRARFLVESAEGIDPTGSRLERAGFATQQPILLGLLRHRMQLLQRGWLLQN